MITQEHRQWQRIPVIFEAKYRDKDKTFTPYHRADLVDIHHQGCRLVGATQFKRGEIVSVLVHLPPEGPLHFEAVAAWSAPVYKDEAFVTGVCFLTENPFAEDTYLKLFHFCLLNMPRRNDIL
ncbi:MAG: PilZ domain-containing protein [Candidatus Omnitrophica bacterium]|nr:PilZ domain-containing protein [Candidatus Omnitrophota bacterium]